MSDIFSLDPMQHMGEPVKGKTYKADGWQYRDIRWITQEQYDELKEILGSENIVALALTKRSMRDGVSIGGQFLISPDGLKRATAFSIKKNSAP